jgi:hypothetical protein
VLDLMKPVGIAPARPVDIGASDFIACLDLLGEAFSRFASSTKVDDRVDVFQCGEYSTGICIAGVWRVAASPSVMLMEMERSA